MKATCHLLCGPRDRRRLRQHLPIARLRHHAAVGDVAPDLGSLQLDTIKVAGGAGVRYRLTDEGANVRLDVAASRDGPLVYLVLLEAF